MSGALVKRAEGLLAGLGDEAHDVTRQVFLRLVTFGEGADDTRRRVLQSELEQLTIDRRMLRAVLDTFGRHRLLSFDRDPVTRSPTVEISHEALLTEWTRLRDWIDGARHDVRNQRRLAEAMREWIAADRAETYLLRGGRLEQMHGWATTTSLPLSGPEQAFLDASVAERDREVEPRPASGSCAPSRPNGASSNAVRQLVGVGLVAVARGRARRVRRRAVAIGSRRQGRRGPPARRWPISWPPRRSALVDDPELSLLLAVQSVRETSRPRLRDRGSDRCGALRPPRARRAVRRESTTPRCRQIGTQRPRRRVCPAPGRVGRARRIRRRATAHGCGM